MSQRAPLLSNFPLTQGEAATPVVHRLVEHLTTKLEQLRKANDDQQLDLYETQWLRGQIKAISDLLKVLSPNERPSVN